MKTERIRLSNNKVKSLFFHIQPFSFNIVPKHTSHGLLNPISSSRYTVFNFLYLHIHRHYYQLPI